ncbi:packaged DNA stabilization protein, partial [Pseudoalteromonas sp.]|uniref:packaged DNA stabilization protein n=1 Tax=Pseudoalteromonas sp. TaxID=53249 RepID=UPI00300254DD
MPAVNLIKGDSLDASGVDYRDSIPVNMYGVLRNTLGSAGYMYQMPGLASFGEASGIDRGGLWVSTPSFEGHYRVSGNDLVSIGAGGSKTVLGTVPGNEQVPMDFTFKDIFADLFGQHNVAFSDKTSKTYPK